MHLFSILVMLIVTLCVGCKGSSGATQEVGKALQESHDVVEVEQWLTATDINSCAALRRVLLSFDKAKLATKYGVRAYRALIERALAQGTPRCDMSADVFNADTSSSPALLLAASLRSEDAHKSLALLGSADAPALLRRKAELLLAVGDPDASREALIESLAHDEDLEVRARAARLSLLAGQAELAWKLSNGRAEDALLLESGAALAAMGRVDELSQHIRSAPLHLRARIAAYALSHATTPMDVVASEDSAAELLLAAAQTKDAQDRDGGAALLGRAAALLPEDADVQQLLARALESQGRVADAIAAWDRAAAIAPAVEAAILVPIRLLRESGRTKEATQRADALSARAKEDSSWTVYRLASLAYKYAGDPKRAVVSARAALQASKDDGRLLSELAMRLEEAGQPLDAGKLLVELLVCGTHGRPWHRHEIAARISSLLDNDALRQRLAALECAAVDQEDLNEHLARLAEGSAEAHSSHPSGE